MSSSTVRPAKSRGLGAVFLGLIKMLDIFRRLVLGLLFVFLVILLVSAMFSAPTLTMPERAALVLEPQGYLVEEFSGSPVDRLIGELTGDAVAEVRLADVVEAIDTAREDDRIEALYLDADGLLGGGLDKVDRIREALAEFRGAGKTVVANGDYFSKAGWLLATASDEVHLHPMGMPLVDGYARRRQYYQKLIDEKLEADWNIFKVGTFKSAVEPFMRYSMSDEAKEANLEWLDDLWSSYADQAAASRPFDRAAFLEAVEQTDVRTVAAGGDGARAALEAGWVDALSHRDEVRARMIELVGENADGDSFAQVSMDDYLEISAREAGPFADLGEGVGILVAAGSIVDGDHPPGTIGGDSTSQRIREAREDDDIKALVLRVDSGGGSAFASELIRRELELTRAAGKPVVVSMGTLAASGGYWISTSADQIWAHPDTLTGSIGIFGMFPTFQKPLDEKLGVRVDGVGTTWLADAIRLDREMPERLKVLFQTMIENGYDEFLERVSNARDMSTEEVDQIAQGRVWSGRDAHELGLVDELGDLDDAVAAAAQLAELGDDYGVWYVEPELSWEEELAIEIMKDARLHALFGPSRVSRLAKFVESFAEPLAGPIEAAASERPFQVVADCACSYE